MRALHLIDHSVPMHSGYSFRSRYIVHVQRRLGIDATVVTSARHDQFEADVEEIEGVRYHRTGKPTDALSRAQLAIPFWRETVMTRAMASRLEQVAREFRPDVIHAHSPFFNGQAALRVGRRLGIPVVYEIRAFWEDDAVDKQKFAEGSFIYKQVRRLETRVVERADHVVAICEGLRKDLADRGIDDGKITVIKNGAEPESFSPRGRPPSLEARFGLTGKKVLGFIGSFFRYEGLPDLVASVGRVAQQRDDFKLLLVGGGEDEEATRSRVDELGLGDRVVFAGRVPHDEVQDHYALIDTFVYPRHSKRITELVTPLKPLEAMAMEKVCIGSDVGGIRELFDECGVGRTFRAGDPADMDRVLIEALDRTPQDLADEGSRGRQAVQGHRRWDRTIAPILGVYANLVRPAAPLATPV